MMADETIFSMLLSCRNTENSMSKTRVTVSIAVMIEAGVWLTKPDLSITRNKRGRSCQSACENAY